MNRFVIVCGPTGVGKTAVAVMLAKKFNGELVSADSRQVYRGMDIGTGKDVASLQGVPIWMYDVVNPDESFSVSQYQKKARVSIEDIQKRNKLPIIIGGTGLYIQSLVETIPTSHIKPNEELRKKLGHYSLEKLQMILQHEFFAVWEKLNFSDRQNPHRLIRKIELGRSGVTTIAKPSPMTSAICWIGLTAPFSYLYNRIDKRVEKRVGQGVVDEVRALIKKGCGWELSSMSALGYREWKDFIEGNASIETVIQKWKYDEHGYARRQMTWFKRNKTIRWFDVFQKGQIEAIESHVDTWYNTK
jgi:tRNA dimethylallyltransferase